MDKAERHEVETAANPFELVFERKADPADVRYLELARKEFARELGELCAIQFEKIAKQFFVRGFFAGHKDGSARALQIFNEVKEEFKRENPL